MEMWVLWFEKRVLRVGKLVLWVNKRILRVEKWILRVKKRIVRVGEEYYKWLGK